MTKPVLNIELLKVAVNAFIIWLVVMGYWPMNEMQQAATITFFMALVSLVGGFFQNQQTTPLAQPEDTDGTPLVRSDTGGQTRSAEKRLAQ